MAGRNLADLLEASAVRYPQRLAVVDVREPDPHIR